MPIRGRRRRKPRRALRDHARWDRNLVQSLSRARFPSWRQIRHLPEVLSGNDSLRLKFGAVLLVAGLAVLGIQFYYGHTKIVPAVGGNLTEGIVGTPRSLNPVLAMSNDVDADLVRLTYSSLFTVDGDGRIVPDLVERYEVSGDHLTYRFFLRENVQWHDGRPLTADDAVFTISLIQDPAWNSPLYDVFKEAEVVRVGEHELTLTLDAPFAPLLSKLRFGIMPRHVWKDVAPADAVMTEENLKPVGSGPFQFEELRRDKRGFVLSYTVERNDDYYKDAPYIKEMTFKFYPDHVTALEALRKRQVDSLSFVPRDMRPVVREMAHVIPASLEIPQYTAVFFNGGRNPALREEAVRRALAMSIDKSRIILEVLGGDGHPLDGPPIFGYSDLPKSSLPHDPDEAAQTLEDAGWETGEDGIRRKDESPLEVTLTSVDQPENLAVMRIIRDGWESVGADVILMAVPPAEVHRTVIRPRAYEALLFGQLLEADPDPYPFWHSSQTEDPGLNLAMFADADADAAIEAARRSGDREERRRQYEIFLSRLGDVVPAAFLYSPSYTYPLPETLEGFSGTRIAGPSDRFATVTEWYLETRRAWE